MSQETDDILRGLAQAAADAFDGALDEKGEHIKIGLKREEGHSVYDSRIPDGFKIKIDGNNCVVLYQSDIKLKDVHNSKFENELERTMASIASFLKKRYKQITGKALTLTAQGDVDALVQSTSRVRVWVQTSRTGLSLAMIKWMLNLGNF